MNEKLNWENGGRKWRHVKKDRESAENEKSEDRKYNGKAIREKFGKENWEKMERENRVEWETRVNSEKKVKRESKVRKIWKKVEWECRVRKWIESCVRS